jgi:hypothetical protein
VKIYGEQVITIAITVGNSDNRNKNDNKNNSWNKITIEIRRDLTIGKTKTIRTSLESYIHVHRSPPLGHILSEMNSHNTPLLSKVNFNIIFPSVPRSYNEVLRPK